MLNRAKIGPLWHLCEAFELYLYKTIGFTKRLRRAFRLLLGYTKRCIVYWPFDLARISNATKAYMVAYPKSSEKAAEAHAARMVRNGKVKIYIESWQEARSERTGIDQD